MEIKRCTRCILPDSIPNIEFDEKGECCYCHLFDSLNEIDYPLNEKGNKQFEELIGKIKVKGKNKQFDCIVGVSGGVDSTYTLIKAKELGLRPLAVHFDNGWNSELAVDNITNILKSLNIELYTYVVNWEEFKDIQRAFLFASVPEAEVPSDIAIVSVLYKIANKFNVKYILNGVSFRTEGNMPPQWGYSDGRYVRSVHKLFGKQKMKTFPNLNLSDVFYYIILKRIKLVRFLNYYDYSKQNAKIYLENNFGWRFPGGHHYESIYTRWYQGFLSPVKFGMDRRLISISAQVRSGHISREEAINIIKKPHYSEEQIKQDTEYILKKLDISGKEFDAIMKAPIHTFRNYPSYYPFLKKIRPLLKILSSLKITPMVYHSKKFID